MTVEDNGRNILFVTKTGVLRNEVGTISCICLYCIAHCIHACLYMYSVTAANDVRQLQYAALVACTICLDDLNSVIVL
jgi:hypothetical protein